MKKIFFRKVSNKMISIIITGIIFIIVLYTVYNIGKVNGLAQCALLFKLPDKTSPVENPIRVPLFINPAFVKYETRFNFTFDPVDVLRLYREEEKLDDIILGASNSFEEVIRLLLWAREQWEPGRPDPYPPINARLILQEIRSGRVGGFCAQYNYIFVQAVQSFGVRARYITIYNHEVTEVWIAKLHKWICFDPFYAAYYTNQAKLPLSVYEIYKAVKQHTPVVIVAKKLIENTEVHMKKFKKFAIWIKNNHISSPINFADIEYYKIHFYEELDELNSFVILNRLTTSSVKDLYCFSYE